MSVISGLPAFQALVTFSVLLALKMGAVAFLTAKARFDSKVVLNPEDAPVNPGSHAEPEEAPATLRAKRAHLNDVENIPVFLVLALLFTLTGCSATAGWIYFGTYFAARTLHTIFYLGAVQPWRTAAFAIGQLIQLGIMVQLVMRAF
jgi:glutathione S-transferase